MDGRLRTYRFDRGHRFHDVGRVGVTGEGNVTFVLDLTTENTTVGFGSSRDRGSWSRTSSSSVAGTTPTRRATVRNVVARHGSAIGHYKGGNGRVGIWIGRRHRGNMGIEDCRLEEFGNNGIYASRCLGNTEVIGGIYRNNNASSVRSGGKGERRQRGHDRCRSREVYGTVHPDGG